MAEATLPGLFALALALAAPAPVVHPPFPAITVAQDDVASRLSGWVQFCATVAGPAYRADCLAERFDAAASLLGPYGDTAEAYRSLKRAARGLSRVSRRYASPTQPAITLASPALTTSRPIQPVAPENLALAAQAALGVIETAELTLLRSASRAPGVAALVRVAEVLGSAKLLLRSG